MYVVTNKKTNVIMEMGEKMDYMSNGYPRLVNENIAFPTWMVFVNGEEAVDPKIPDTIVVPDEVEPAKWCYSREKDFYLNPNYKEVEAEVKE